MKKCERYTRAKPKLPGWYWVQRDGLWPQCIPFSFIGREGLVAPQRYTDRLINWEWFCGPIQEPALDCSTKRSVKGRKVVC